MKTNHEELMSLIESKLDVTEFLDACGLSFAELLQIVLPELNEEQIEELDRITTD